MGFVFGFIRYRTGGHFAYTIGDPYIDMAWPGNWRTGTTEWQRLGMICLARPPIALGGSWVEFFATSKAEGTRLKPAFERFAATLPKQTIAVP